MAAQKQIVPTVKPKAQVIDLSDHRSQGEGSEAGEGGTREKGEPNLPPISHIKPPKMLHTSTKIRWYLGLGYKVKEVSDFLGIRYQQVRNVGTQSPKRAAREDVPPYIIELHDLEDDLEAMEIHALEQQMAIQRAEDRQARQDARRGRSRVATATSTGDDND